MLQFEELKLALDELKPDLSDLEEALDLKAAGEEIEKLEAQAAEPEFWNDMSHSQKILQRTSTLKNKVSKPGVSISTHTQITLYNCCRVIFSGTAICLITCGFEYCCVHFSSI